MTHWELFCWMHGLFATGGTAILLYMFLKKKIRQEQVLPFVLLFVGASLIGFGFLYDVWKIRDLRINGTKGKARVISAEQGWIELNKSKEVILQVEVELPNGKSFETEIRHFVAPFAVHGIVAYMGQVRVLYDPESLDYAIVDPNPL